MNVLQCHLNYLSRINIQNLDRQREERGEVVKMHWTKKFHLKMSNSIETKSKLIIGTLLISFVWWRVEIKFMRKSLVNCFKSLLWKVISAVNLRP